MHESVNDYYVHIQNDTMYIKEAKFFESQGGLTEEWGKHWQKVRGTSILQCAHTVRLIENPDTPDIYGQKHASS